MKTNKNTIVLTDTFNGRVISTHRTVAAAVRAQHRHLAEVRRYNGRDSYLTYSIQASDGSDISELVDAARVELGY